MEIDGKMRPSFATRLNLDVLEENYRRWQENPEALDPAWSAFYEGFELGNLEKRNGAAAKTKSAEGALFTRVDGLVYAYSTLGHTIARLNPLADKRPENSQLSLRELGFTEADLDRDVSSKFFLDGKQMRLREMIAQLEHIYADTIG
ncbi:MAG: 2-oxoglutarate dehydrogenase E1 component, partial [Verrucomicrobiota bacterium]|nr:2-oxoglutarate dehydrogenase E1 component [Verrucomicrobiota bacterium]